MANTRITQGVIKPNEDYDVRHINATGIITATNVNVSGVLTYEDVTNVDSIGIITARKGIVSSGVVTATAFHGSGASLTGIDATALKDPDGNVKIQAQASGAVHTGFSTMQNLRVTGIATFGTSSTVINGGTDTINVGTALTLGHTQGLQFHTQNLHSEGFEVNQINASGIITASSFSGDGSNLTSLPAGLGTALSSTQSSPLNKIYYTNTVLPVESTITVDTPASASAAYTQYADISVGSGADLIISDGDDLIPDVLGLRPDGTFGGGSTLGRLRVDKIVGKDANSAINAEKGLVVTGVVTATTFSGSGASLTNLPSAQLTGALPAIDGSNLTGLSGVSVANQADNRLITATGTTDALNGEVNLTWNGQTFEAYNLSGPSYIAAKSNTNSGDYGIVQVQSGSTVRGRLVSDASVDAFRLDTAGRASAPITFHTGSSYTEKLRIKSDGKVNITPGGAISGTHPPGDLNIVGTNFITMTPNVNTNASDNEVLGRISFLPYAAGTISGASAKIEAVAEPTQSGSANPTSLRFYTKPSGTGPGSAGNERMRITQDGQLNVPSQPSFAAYRSVNDYSLNNAIFPFNATKHNVGGHFSTTTHRFTAPVAGRYLFTFWAIYISNVNNAYYTIRINGSAGPGMYTHFTKQHSQWDHVSSSYIFNLSQNDYVDMFSNSNVGWHGNSWQLFSGQLLS